MTAEQRAAGRPGGRPGVAALTIDALGRKCPIPIIMLAERIREVAIGQTVEVLADDPAAKSDLPGLVQAEVAGVRGPRELGSGWSFLVRRSY